MERTRIFRLVGRRGLVLLIFGALWVTIGVGALTVPPPVPRFSGTGHAVPILSLLDGPQAGWIWVGSGAGAIVTGLVRRRRHGRDAVGFNFLLGPPILWALAYVWSFFMWVTTGEGRVSAWAASLVWVVFCAFIMLIAGWPDPDDPAYRLAEK